MKEHGQHVQVDVTLLRRFEDFATVREKAALTLGQKVYLDTVSEIAS
jgi:hypothetical protein